MAMGECRQKARSFRCGPYGRRCRIWLGTLLVGAAAMLAAAPASSAVRITHDIGGQIGPYLQKFAALRDSGERVIIDGPCMSACTLVLAVVPARRVCVTPRALLGFHAAWYPDAAGRPVYNLPGTRLLWALYPAKIRQWLSRHGGLTVRTLLLRGRELAAIVSRCEREA